MSFTLSEVDLSSATINSLDASRTGRRSTTGRLILYESFESPILARWTVNDKDPKGVTERSFNRAWEGRASLYINNPNAATSQDQDARMGFTAQTDKVGAEVYYTFNDVMRATGAGQTIYLSVEYWDGNNRREARVDYYPNSKLLRYTHDANVQTTISTLSGAGPSQRAYDDTGASVRFKESWNWMKVVVDRSANSYVSIETPEIGLVQGSALPAGNNLNSLTDSSVLTGQKYWAIELAISGGGVAPSSPFEAYFDALAVTDES